MNLLMLPVRLAGLAFATLAPGVLLGFGAYFGLRLAAGLVHFLHFYGWL
jgi:hypothetical protein